MNEQLARDKASLKDILEHTLSIAENFFDTKDSIPPGRLIPDIDIGSLPENGIGAIETLNFFQKNFADKLANSSGPNYFGFVTGGSTPASIAGDWLVSSFDQNACGSNDSIAPQIERQTIHFLKELFGLQEAYVGTFVTGATMSNFVSLAVARQWVGEQHGVDFSEVGLGSVAVRIVSATPHSSILKAMSMLGIGRQSLVKVDTLPDREAIDVEALENWLTINHAPCIVVANAGTVNTVDFDRLDAIGKLKEKYRFWLHVDAAFGGFAACSEKYAHLLNGINLADSITIDAHKWLNVPYDAAMQFNRHQSLQLKVFQNSAAYLGDPQKSPDLFHYTPENSRRFRALPSWCTLMAYGKRGHAEIVERNCASAFQLGQLISTSSHFKLLAPVRMNVVCFTISKEGLTFPMVQEFLNSVRDDGRVFFTPTVYKGTPAIRAAISNWQTEDSHINGAFGVLTEVWQRLNVAESVIAE